MAGKNAAAATVPADLAAKRSANSLTAVQAETEREQAEDRRVVVTLKTRLGFHDMHVAPMEEWTSVARHAMNRDDSLTWAQRTLPPEDALRWMQLDPTLKDEAEFWTDLGRAYGQSLGEGNGSARS